MGWVCAVGAFPTLLITIGGALLTGDWPTEGGQIGSKLNAANKRSLNEDSSYRNMGGLYDHFNDQSLLVEMLTSFDNFTIQNGQAYLDGFWIRLLHDRLGPLIDHWVHSSTPYVATAGYGGQSANTNEITKHLSKSDDYQLEYNDEVSDDTGMITSFCRYNRGSSALSAPTDMNSGVPALNDFTGFFYYSSSPYHWVMKDNNHDSRHITVGIIVFSDTFNGGIKGGPPTGGFPTTCWGDHDDIGA